MSTYPGTLDSFVAKTDNVDDVMAVDINELQAAIVAVETELGTDPAGSATDLKTRLALAHDNAGHLEFAAPTLVTISGGVVTATQNYHTIDTEGGAGSDNLDTINGGTDGLVLVMRTVSSARDVVVKHNTGNIWCVGGTDFSLDTADDILIAVYDATNSRWHAGRLNGGNDVDGSGTATYITMWSDANTLAASGLTWASNTLTIGTGAAGIDYAITINGENKDITLTWMEDEGYLSISQDLLMATAEVIYFRDTDIYIHSESDGKLVLTADVSVQINAPTITLQDAGDIALVFDGGSNDGTITWMEDENYFLFADDILMSTTERIYFRSNTISIYSHDESYLDISAANSIILSSPTVEIGTNSSVDPTLAFLGDTNDGQIVWMEDEAYFRFSNDILLQDSENAYFGTGVDMGIYYDGTNGNIDTDLVAASDLTIDCGTGKTVVLEIPVYQDANVGSLVLQTGGTLPGIVEILDKSGNQTGIYTRGFAVGEEGSGVIEVPHDYKEGTDLVFHIHWGGRDAPTGTDYVAWQLTYGISRESNTFPAVVTPAKAEVAYATTYNYVRTNVATITGSTGGVDGGNIKIGDQFCFTLKRVAADGDAFAGEALAETMGFHYQVDTLGSRTITAK